MLDRSVVIRLERKGAGETVARLRADRGPSSVSDLRRQMRRWADDHQEAMRGDSNPRCRKGSTIAPSTTRGRCWRSRNWSAARGPNRRRAALLALAGDDVDESPIGEELLADLKTIFDDDDTAFEREDRGRALHGPRDRVPRQPRVRDRGRPTAGKPRSRSPSIRSRACSGGSRCTRRRTSWAVRAMNGYRRADLDPGVGSGICHPAARSEPRNRPMIPGLNRRFRVGDRETSGSDQKSAG